MDIKKLNLASFAALILILFFFCFKQNETSLAVCAGSCVRPRCMVLVQDRQIASTVTALDLAASGVDPLQTISLKSISEYFKPLRHVMEGLGASLEGVVLVGHSLGGLALSEVKDCACSLSHCPDSHAGS